MSDEPNKIIYTMSRVGKSYENREVLKDISLSYFYGAKIGVLGLNGSGKSTLLKILARITEPTTGWAEVDGRVGSLLEVGTGFHPELTGRENIHLNGAILGMRRAEVGRKFDEIVAFAEVEQFIDTPVKHYSSGMQVRLAFAVAAHLEPEILLVDEVLAVGDAAFQEKCLNKMGAVARGGRTILFVSHNMAAVLALCSRAYLLGQGNLIASGTPSAVVETYLDQRSTAAPLSLRDRQDRQGNGRMRFLDLAVRNAQGNPVELVASGQDVVVEISYAAKSALRNVSVSLGVYGMFGQFLLFCGNEMTGDLFRSLPAQGKLLCRIPRMPHAPGRYL